MLCNHQVHRMRSNGVDILDIISTDKKISNYTQSLILRVQDPAILSIYRVTQIAWPFFFRPRQFSGVFPFIDVCRGEVHVCLRWMIGFDVQLGNHYIIAVLHLCCYIGLLFQEGSAFMISNQVIILALAFQLARPKQYAILY